MNTARTQVWKYIGLLSATLVVGGCANFATSKSTPLSDQMIDSHKGNFEGLYAAWVKPQINLENGSGAKYGKMDVTDLDGQRATEQAISKDFERFCKANGGTLDVQPNKYGQKNVCNDVNGAFLGEIETSRFVEGLAIKVDSRELRKQKQEADQAAEDARRKRDYAHLAPDLVGSLSVPELSKLISEFENNDPQNLVPKAKERRTALLAENMRVAAERDRQHLLQMQAEHEAKMKARENRQIGDQVCYDTDAVNIDVSTGMIVMGQEQYRTVKGNTRVVGFVEAVNKQNNKIKIRISGINFSSQEFRQALDSVSHFKGGVTLHQDSIIWDDTHDWDGC